MKRLQLIKWHAEELRKLLLQDPNNSLTSPMAAELEAVFINSSPFKGIDSRGPDEVD